MTQKIFLIAGEASGDILGAGLMRDMKAQIPDLEFSGIGSHAMEAEGLSSMMPMADICVMGIFEIALQLSKLFQHMKTIVEAIETQQPDILVTIDLPDFNFRIAQQLKKRGIFKGKIIHYVAPSVWAWRSGRAKYVSGFLDGLMCLFPFEPEYFTPHGLKAEYVGHSVIEQDYKKGEGSQTLRQLLEVQAGTNLLGVYMGSREQEIKKHAPILRETLQEIYKEYQEFFVLVPTLPDLEVHVRSALSGLDVPFFVISDPQKKWDAMKACDTAIAVSGTIGLELAYMGVPHAVTYKANALTAFLVKRLARVEHVHLANILLKKEVVPEYLQKDCDPAMLSYGVLAFMRNDAERAKQIDAFKILREAMSLEGDLTPSQKAAAFVLDYL